MRLVAPGLRHAADWVGELRSPGVWLEGCGTELYGPTRASAGGKDKVWNLVGLCTASVTLSPRLDHWCLLARSSTPAELGRGLFGIIVCIVERRVLWVVVGSCFFMAPLAGMFFCEATHMTHSYIQSSPGCPGARLVKPRLFQRGLRSPLSSILPEVVCEFRVASCMYLDHGRASGAVEPLFLSVLLW